MTSIFVINLDARPDRMQAASERLGRIDVPFERFRAVEPAELRDHGVTRAAPWLSDGELACVASHLAVYSEVLRRGLEHAVIMEDDVVPGARFARRLAKALSDAPPAWMLLQLGWLQFETFSHRTVSAVTREALGPRVQRFNRLFAGKFRLGTHCYVVSADFARYALANFREVTAPLDLLLADHSSCPPVSSRCYVHLPSIACQDDSPSDLAERSLHRFGFRPRSERPEPLRPDRHFAGGTAG